MGLLLYEELLEASIYHTPGRHQHIPIHVLMLTQALNRSICIRQNEVQNSSTTTPSSSFEPPVRYVQCLAALRTSTACVGTFIACPLNQVNRLLMTTAAAAAVFGMGCFVLHAHHSRKKGIPWLSIPTALADLDGKPREGVNIMARQKDTKKAAALLLKALNKA